MESQRLDESWCVVVVVTPESVDGVLANAHQRSDQFPG